MLEEKLSSLSKNHRNALAADVDEIMYTTAGDIGIYYDDSGMYRMLEHLPSIDKTFVIIWLFTAFLVTKVFMIPISHSLK